MKDLIERLEKATGPDRELDAMIGAACQIVDDFNPLHLIPPIFYVGDEKGTIRIYAGKIEDSVRHHKYSRKARPFTSSMDAALSLVPEGSTWDLTFDDYLIACVGSGHNTGKHNTAPAIAICIAALKSRA